MHRPQTARQFLDQAGPLRQSHHAQPERHDADQAERDRDRGFRAVESAIGHLFQLTGQRRRSRPRAERARARCSSARLVSSSGSRLPKSDLRGARRRSAFDASLQKKRTLLSPLDIAAGSHSRASHSEASTPASRRRRVLQRGFVLPPSMRAISSWRALPFTSCNSENVRPSATSFVTTKCVGGRGRDLRQMRDAKHLMFAPPARAFSRQPRWRFRRRHWRRSHRRRAAGSHPARRGPT